MTNNPRLDSLTELPSKLPLPSVEIVRILNLLRDRIAKLSQGKNALETKLLRQTVVLDQNGCIAKADIEDALLGDYLFQGFTAPLFELFRTECIFAGSLDSDAIEVRLGVEQRIRLAREAAERIFLPTDYPNIELVWKDLLDRENANSASKADALLRQSIAAINACAKGRLVQPTSQASKSPFERLPDEDGPILGDFRSFRLRGKVLYLSDRQACVVEIYWNARMQGANSFSQKEALAQAELKSKRIRDLFKSNGKVHPNFAKLFTKTGEGMFKLNVV